MAQSDGFKLKETLQHEDIKLTRKLHKTDRQYREIYSVVQRLSDTYERCKRLVPPWRYKRLKDTIKMTISDSAEQASQQQDHGPPAGLVQLVQTFQQRCSVVGAAEDSVDKILKLHKADLIQDIEKKKKIKHRYDEKFSHIRNRLERLKRDYAESKHINFIHRYRAMKEMIKTVIRDESLQPEDF